MASPTTGMSEPILFLLGSSGVGKTYLANFLERELNYVHINFDPEFDVTKGFVDGPRNEGLSNEWKKFSEERNPQPLAETIRERIRSAGRRGASITLQSFYGPDFIRSHISGLRSLRIFYVVLYGPEEECYKAFFARPDGLTQQQKNKASWTRTNSCWHQNFHPNDFQGNVIPLFAGSTRRPNQEILAEVCKAIEPAASHLISGNEGGAPRDA